MIQPEKPNQNAFVESFNGTFRDECLSESWFIDLSDARRTIEAWRLEYNEERGPGSLGRVPPAEYAAAAALHSPTAPSEPMPLLTEQIFENEPEQLIT
ncbi:MAG: transposase [Acidobacteriota bacterium]|nr:MAG: transposase [Acidobacteriota bacterium]